MTTDLPMPSVADPPAGVPSAQVRPTFEQIFQDEAAYVGRTLRYLGVREPHVEDASQEVFIVIHRRLGKLSGGSVRTWVRSICVRVAGNHRRGLRRRPEKAAAQPPEVAVAPTQHGEAERRQAQHRLLRALDTLTEDQRNAFVLYEIEQLTLAELAEAVGCPLQTAYSRLYAARTKVQTAMKDSGP